MCAGRVSARGPRKGAFFLDDPAGSLAFLALDVGLRWLGGPDGWYALPDRTARVDVLAWALARRGRAAVREGRTRPPSAERVQGLVKGLERAGTAPAIAARWAERLAGSGETA